MENFSLQLDNVLNLINSGDYKEAKDILMRICQTGCEKNIQAIKYLGLVNINLNLFDEAFDNFYFLTTKYPEDILSFYYLGIIYDAKNENEKAQQCFLKVINNMPNYLNAFKSYMVSCLKQKEYSQIIGLETSINSLEEKDEYIYNMLAIAYFETGNFNKALEYYTLALQQNENNIKTLNQLANTYLSMNDIDSALNTYKKAVKLDTETGLSSYNLGMLYFSINDYKNAYKMLKIAYKRDKNHVYLSSLALATLALFKWTEAIEYYEQLIKLFPNDDTHTYNLGCAYLGDKQYSKAISIFERLYSLYPKSVALIKHLATAYLETSNYKEACDLYKILISATPFDTNLYYEYALLCVKISDFDKAEEILKKIILIEQNNAIFHKDLAIVYLSRKMFNKAKEEFETAYKLEPDNIIVLSEYANYFHIMSDFKAANKLYQKILKSNQQLNSSTLLSIAINCIALNMKNKALKLLLEANEMTPQNHSILFNLGRVYLMLEKKNIAKSFIEDAYSIEPDIESANLLAQLYYEEGDYTQALTLFKLVNLAAPNNISVLLFLAKCLNKLNDFKNAKTYLDTILSIYPEHEEAKTIYAELNESEK